MSSYKELVQQRAALEQQIAEARMRETSEAIAQVHTLIADFDLTQEDIFPTTKGRGAKRASSGKVAPKYRDPATGSTWTGRGKPPRWIQDQDRTAFAIE